MNFWTVRTTCPYCGVGCQLTYHVKDNTIIRVDGRDGPSNHNRLCVKGRYGQDYARHPQRLTVPLIRRPDAPKHAGAVTDAATAMRYFREASWDEALSLVADRLGDIRAEYGATSVLNLASAGCTSALHGTIPLLRRFLNFYGGATRFTGSYSIGAIQFILPYLFGEDWKNSGFDAATMQHSEMIILWGANVLEARLGTDVNARLLEAARRGAQIVVIDPRRSRSAPRTWRGAGSRTRGCRCTRSRRGCAVSASTRRKLPRA